MSNEEVQRPTPEDFAALETYVERSNKLDHSKVERIRAVWHLQLPEPYSVAVHELDLTDPGITKALSSAVENDSALSEEQKHVLDHELSDRARIAVLATASEGWND
jgi:hypothetical protein